MNETTTQPGDGDNASSLLRQMTALMLRLRAREIGGKEARMALDDWADAVNADERLECAVRLAKPDWQPGDGLPPSEPTQDIGAEPLNAWDRRAQSIYTVTVADFYAARWPQDAQVCEFIDGQPNDVYAINTNHDGTYRLVSDEGIMNRAGDWELTVLPDLHPVHAERDALAVKLAAVTGERDRYKAALEQIDYQGGVEWPGIQHSGNIDHVEEMAYRQGKWSAAVIARNALLKDDAI